MLVLDAKWKQRHVLFWMVETYQLHCSRLQLNLKNHMQYADVSNFSRANSTTDSRWSLKEKERKTRLVGWQGKYTYLDIYLIYNCLHIIWLTVQPTSVLSASFQHLHMSWTALSYFQRSRPAIVILYEIPLLQKTATRKIPLAKEHPFNLCGILIRNASISMTQKPRQLPATNSGHLLVDSTKFSTLDLRGSHYQKIAKHGARL